MNRRIAILAVVAVAIFGRSAMPGITAWHSRIGAHTFTSKVRRTMSRSVASAERSPAPAGGVRYSAALLTSTSSPTPAIGL